MRVVLDGVAEQLAAEPRLAQPPALPQDDLERQLLALHPVHGLDAVHVDLEAAEQVPVVLGIQGPRGLELDAVGVYLDPVLHHPPLRSGHRPFARLAL